MKAILLLAVALAIPAALIVLPSLGLFERFQNGLIDESALARVNIYRLFELVSWKEILLGTDIANIRCLALCHFDLEFIESSLVMFVFQLARWHGHLSAVSGAHVPGIAFGSEPLRRNRNLSVFRYCLRQ